MKNKEARIRTIGFSLASKLNIQLWVRLIGMFLVINILFFITAFGLLIYNGEKKIHDAVTIIKKTGSPSIDDFQWMELADISIEQAKGVSKGYKIPDFLRITPKETAGGVRFIDIPDKQNESFFRKYDNFRYGIDLSIENAPYRLTVDLSKMVKCLKTLFFVIFFAQGVFLIKSVLSYSKMIRKALQPISELAAQARTLSSGQEILSTDEMEALAGTLDEINAARLDTRIDLAGTQDELKNVAVAINSLLDRMNESYRSQARFVSDASHELRTPIAAIQGYANLLDRWGKYDKEALQESIDAIKEEAANMKDLIEQLLFLARGDNHTMALQKERFDLGLLAQTIYKEAQMIDDGHDFEIMGTEVFILADQGLIKQAGRILVDNAIKYTPAGGKIKISVEMTTSQARFTVQDNGIGIPNEAIPQVFDRFYRADESRARATGGTGLGLSIAQWIAERHGGHMEVLSREDFGSRFSLVLPKIGSGSQQ